LEINTTVGKLCPAGIDKHDSKEIKIVGGREKKARGPTRTHSIKHVPMSASGGTWVQVFVLLLH